MNKPNVLSSIKQWGNLEVVIADPCGKIGAINYGIKEASEGYDIIVLASDDMVPTGYGWDRHIINCMTKHYPDTDGVLWFNDGHVGDTLNTLSILGKQYLDRFGYIYHPSYEALWCDNEFMDVANLLGKQTYFNECIIRHEHPAWTNKAHDNLNMRDNQYYTMDKLNYEHRKANNFDIVINTNTNTAKPEGDVQQAIRFAEQPDLPKRGRRKRTDLQS
jgi:hypothetical protein